MIESIQQTISNHDPHHKSIDDVPVPVMCKSISEVEHQSKPGKQSELGKPRKSHNSASSSEKPDGALFAMLKAMDSSGKKKAKHIKERPQLRESAQDGTKSEIVWQSKTYNSEDARSSLPAEEKKKDVQYISYATASVLIEEASQFGPSQTDTGREALPSTLQTDVVVMEVFPVESNYSKQASSVV